MIPNELKIDPASVSEKLVKFLKDEFKKRSFKHAVVGLSGGVDSSLVASLAKEALGAGNVLGIHMPYARSEKDMKDVEALVAKLGIKFMLIDIAPMVDAYFCDFPDADRIRRGNKMARERMSILYDQSRKFDALVLGCGNKTEILVGYFTLYGDSGCAVNPIGSLYKTQVWEMAKALGVPQSIIERKPSAGLWQFQTDEDELGISYAELDRLLYYMVDKKFPDKELEGKGFSKEVIDKIAGYISKTTFKRDPPAVARL